MSDRLREALDRAEAIETLDYYEDSGSNDFNYDRYREDVVRAALAYPVPTEVELRKVAHKAAQIGFTYGALGRDFTFAYKDVEDLLNNPERAKP